MIFAMFLGQLGAKIRFYSQLSPLKKTNYISIKSETAKKTPPCHYIKLETLKPRNSPLYQIRKPNKEALQGTCVTLLFYGVLICYSCSILHVFSCFPILFCWSYLPFFYRGNHRGGSASGDSGTPATRGNTTSHHEGKTSQCIWF